MGIHLFILKYGNVERVTCPMNGPMQLAGLFEGSKHETKVIPQKHNQSRY